MGVRVLEKSDLEFSVRLTVEEKWFYTVTELERMLELDPEGSFVFQEGGERLGFVTTVTYGRTGFLGHLIVSGHARGRRIGDALVSAAVEYMHRAGAESMVLYASGGLRLYEKHGFRPRQMALATHSRFEGVKPTETVSRCSKLTRNDLEEAIAMDRELFGDDRTRLYEILFRDHPEMAFKIDRGAGMEGFIFARPNHAGYDLGPWICKSKTTSDAEELFRKELSVMNRGMIYTGMFETNKTAISIVRTLEEARMWKVPMMVRGKERYQGPISGMYAVPAMELG